MLIYLIHHFWLNVKLFLRADCGLRIADCGVRSVEWGVWSVEWGVGIEKVYLHVVVAVQYPYT